MEFLYSDEGQLLLLKGLGHPIRFADLVQRGVVPDSLLNRLLRVEPYLTAEFPTGEPFSTQDTVGIKVYSVPGPNSGPRPAVVAAVIEGLLAAGLFIPGIVYIVAPFLKETVSEDWIQIGPTSKVEIGTPTLFSVKTEQKTGWITNLEEITVYLYTENGRDYVAMSNICTHLGCRVRWIDGRQEFYCPCHNGVFDKEGNVMSGPPPRPLDQYETKVVDNQIYIKAG